MMEPNRPAKKVIKATKTVSEIENVSGMKCASLLDVAGKILPIEKMFHFVVLITNLTTFYHDDRSGDKTEKLIADLERLISAK